MSPLLLIPFIFATPVPVDTGLFGLQLGATQTAVRAAYAPTGAPKTLNWTEAAGEGGLVRLLVRCRATALCFGVPAEADFVFVEDRLVAATLRADAERAPAEHPLRETLLALSASSGLTVADATARSVGRFTRYFLRPLHTVAWVQDGPDVEIKLYLDEIAPLGRAEAAAAGAKTNLDALPGAALYARAHAAVAERDFDDAIDALDLLMGMKTVSGLLREQGALILAMSLAARAQRWGKTPSKAPKDWAQRAAADLSRAATLAPALADELRALGTRLSAQTPSGTE